MGDTFLMNVQHMNLTKRQTCGTFSIVGMDPDTREWGVAVASRIYDCGYVIVWLRPEAGAVATQGMVNARLGPLALDRMSAGMTAGEALQDILSMDPGCSTRQLGVIDRHGNSAAHTGSDSLEWAGHLTGDFVSVQGNVVTGPRVVSSMLDTFRKTEGELAERLLSALEAGESAGGDRRGRQSAALMVTRENGGYEGTDDRLVQISVPDHPEPVLELRRLYEMWKYAFIIPAYLRLADENRNSSDAFRLRVHGLIGKALDGNLGKPEICNSLAWHLAQWKGFAQESIMLARRAHELAPDDPNIMDTLAEAFFVAGEISEALHYAKEAIKREPGNGYFRQQLERFMSKL
jgi:uncharacterized Ntn-hydrolase superfamily protein